MLLFEVIILSIICLSIIFLIFKKIKDPQKYPPGPWNLPIVGYLPFLGKQPQKKFMNLAKKYGNIFQIYLGNKRVVVLNGQAIVREALTDSKAANFASRPDNFIRKFLRTKAQGVLGAKYGPELKIRRKIVIRALTKCANRGQRLYHETLEQAVDKLVSTFTNKAGQPYDPKEDINQAVGKIYLGNKRVVVLNGQAIVREALADSKAVDFASRPELFIRKFVRQKGIGVLNSKYDLELKIRRKIVIRALTKCANRGQKVFHETIEQAVDKLVRTFTDKAGQIYDPKVDIDQAVGKVISSLCFGQDFLKYEKDYYSIILNIGRFTKLASVGNILNFFPLIKPFFKKRIKEFLEMSADFDKICSKSLQYHEESLDDENPRDIAYAIIKTIKEMKMEGENVIEISRNDIIVIIRELLFAGFATVATTLRWGIYYIIAHPEVQKRIQKELDATIPENEKVSLSYRDKLPYTEATLLEIHRFASLVAMGVPRATSKNTMFHGYYIPKDTMVFPNLWSVHRDPIIWNEPDQFNPLRFLNSDHTKIQSSLADKILPFGAGRRRCAGEILARMELFIFFAILMRQFEFSSLPGHELNLKDFESEIGLNTKSIPICIKVRKKN